MCFCLFCSFVVVVLFHLQDGVGVDEKLSLRRVAVVEDFFDIIYSMHVETGPNGEQIRKHAGQKRTYKAVSGQGERESMHSEFCYYVWCLTWVQRFSNVSYWVQTRSHHSQSQYLCHNLLFAVSIMGSKVYCLNFKPVSRILTLFSLNV